MMTLLSVLFVVSFIGYHYTFFSYCAYIFNTNKLPIYHGIICGAVNLCGWAIYVFFVPIQLEPVMLIVCAIILVIETKIVFKTDIIQTLFTAVTFTINLFAKRIAVLATIALFTHEATIVDAVASTELSLIASIACFTVSISTITFARTKISRNSLDTILADNKNLTFLTTAFSIVFFTLFTFLLTIGIDIGGNELLYHYVVLGFVSITAFAIFIVFAHNLAELRISTETYKKLSQKNSEDLERLKDLEQEAIKDNLTGLYTRDFADTTAKKIVEESSSAFVAFIDLDGLKTVNDIYGHEEGDFYIKSVADILKNYFRDESVCRYGGDEMLVIGKYNTEDEVTKKLVWCYKAVLDISTKHKKNYSTSISYGSAFKHLHETISSDELIAIADTRMYEIKKSNKKHRKVVSVRANSN